VAQGHPPLPEHGELTVANDPVVELRGVRKTFTVAVRRGRVRRQHREVHAVDGIDLAIERGAMIGYLGPNGAGKSTTIKMLTGILVPSSGTVRVDGLDPSRRRIDVARRIGVVFGQRSQLWWDLPLGDSFDLLRHVYGVPAERHRRTAARLVELLDLGENLATPVRQLSLGQRMRGELVAALLHEPTLLFLDEPTIGLDIVSQEAVRGFLAELNAEQGTTVVLTTHDLADVERLCRRILVIDHGRIIEDADLDEIRTRYGTERTVVVDLESAGPPLDIPGATVTAVEGARQWLRFGRDETTAAAVVAAVAARVPVRDLTVEEPAIDDIVRAIYAAGDRAAGGRI
jgi:ABC-2 type transport system ATP-binding protein